MKNKLAKLEYLPNNFKVLEPGDHVVCAVSGKEINLDQMKLLVSAYKTCPLGESPHRLVAID